MEDDSTPRRGGTMIFPDSDRRRLSSMDVKPLSRSELRIARNEIYARHGLKFHDPDLSWHFAQFDWYQPLHIEVTLNRIEASNVSLIEKVEALRAAD